MLDETTERFYKTRLKQGKELVRTEGNNSRLRKILVQKGKQGELGEAVNFLRVRVVWRTWIGQNQSRSNAHADTHKMKIEKITANNCAKRLRHRIV